MDGVSRRPNKMWRRWKRQDREKHLKFNISASWALFHCQFMAMADHKWISCKKTHSLTILKEQAADTLHSQSDSLALRRAVMELTSLLISTQLIQLSGKTLQEFAALNIWPIRSLLYYPWNSFRRRLRMH
jgi:hypothetical protein